MLCCDEDLKRMNLIFSLCISISFFLAQEIDSVSSSSRSGLQYCESEKGNLSHFLEETGNKNDNYFPPGRFSAGSPPLLQLLARKETKIFSLVTNFREELLLESRRKNGTFLLKDCVEAVDFYLKNFEGTPADFLGPEKISWNPIASFRLIQRFAVDLKNLLSRLIGTTKNEESLKLQTAILNLMNLEDDLGWPTEDDIFSVMDAIIRIQIVYNLPAKELAQGTLKTRKTQVALNPVDCHKIGKYLFDTGCCLSQAIEWLEVASTLVKTNNCSSNFAKMLANDLTIAKQKLRDSDDDDQGQIISRNRFWRLCDGENFKNPHETKNLFCFYKTKVGGGGAWTISPIKVELLSMDPVIVQYYDAVSDQLMNKIRTLAIPQVVRSRVFDEDEEKEGRSGDVVNYRTSFTAWLTESGEKKMDDELTKIPKMIEFLTGLTVAKEGAAERLQVAAYASGGHYEVHVDEVPEPTVRGGRVATFMIYLSEVEEGGFTAFPIVGVAARPVKGSAVFWFNLLSTGQLDERTEHGACPIILGEKWVANKWILFDEQFASHKCGLRDKLPLRFDLK